MKFPAYPKYKPSGVEWLGDVPDKWAVQGVKFCYSIQLGKMLQPDPSSPSDEETPYLKSQHVQWEHVRVADLPTMWTTKIERKKYAVADGDLLVCEGGDVGRAAVVYGAPDRTIIQNALHRVRPQRENVTGFLLYVLAHAASQGWFDILCNKSTIAHFTVEKFGALGVALPSPNEQQDIADFLNAQMARLDALLTKRRALIEKLLEKRTALISHTITRGLNPKAKFKPSGVEWLGDIPEHWEIWKYAHLFTSSMGQTILKEQVADSGLIPVLSATEKYEVFGYLDSAAVLLDAGDLVIPARGNSIGHVKLVRERSTTTQTTIYSKHLTKKVDPKYAFYFLLGHRKTLFHFDRTAIPQLTVNQVSTNLFLLPSFPEQAAIVEFLDRETTKLDQMMAKVEAAISKLQEYRTALITAAVTGKIDVRHNPNTIKL
jgi:type I restriction enzyme S subunit